MDLSKYKRTASDIFVYKNLRDFEKVLFLEHNVSGLILLLKKKNKHIIELCQQIERIIEENEESKKILALKAEITNNQRVILKYKKLYQESINKND